MCGDAQEPFRRGRGRARVRGEGGGGGRGEGGKRGGHFMADHKISGKLR